MTNKTRMMCAAWNTVIITLLLGVWEVGGGGGGGKEEGEEVGRGRGRRWEGGGGRSRGEQVIKTACHCDYIVHTYNHISSLLKYFLQE